MSRYLVLLLVTLLTACAGAPKTAEKAYWQSRVVRQPDGNQLVVGPEIPFTVRGARGVTGFRALVTPQKTRFYQKTSIGMSEDAGTFEASRAQMEQYRRRGASLAVRDSGVRVQFTPAYVEGFLRRVDEVAR
jgi:hypothetical protein